MKRITKAQAKQMTTYKAPRISLLMVSEPCKDAVLAIRTPDDAAKVLEPLRHSPEEKFVAMFLDTQHNLIGVSEISHGTISSSLVHPREVFKGALVCNACGVIVAHNHPSGSRVASREDIQVTEQLLKAGVILGVPIVDHFIVTPHGMPISIRETHSYLWSE